MGTAGGDRQLAHGWLLLNWLKSSAPFSDLETNCGPMRSAAWTDGTGIQLSLTLVLNIPYILTGFGSDQRLTPWTSRLNLMLAEIFPQFINGKFPKYLAYSPNRVWQLQTTCTCTRGIILTRR